MGRYILVTKKLEKKGGVKETTSCSKLEKLFNKIKDKHCKVLSSSIFLLILRTKYQIKERQEAVEDKENKTTRETEDNASRHYSGGYYSVVRLG